MRSAFALAALVVTLLAAYMALHFGRRREDFEIMGPGYTPPPVEQSSPKAAPKPIPTPSAAAAPKTPVAPTGAVGAMVDVSIPGGVGELYIDGHFTPVKERFTTPLDAGQHVLIWRNGGRTVVRRVYVSTGTSTQVDFASP